MMESRALTIHNFDASMIARMLLGARPTPRSSGEQIARALFLFLKDRNVAFRVGSSFRIEDPQIHFGMAPIYKAAPSYRRLFFEHVPGFVGVSANTFQDWSQGRDDSLAAYVMLSVV